MTEKRTRNGVMKTHPLPVLKINGNLRFLRSSVDQWLAKLLESKAA
jgi:hypothetical protein